MLKWKLPLHLSQPRMVFRWRRSGVTKVGCLLHLEGLYRLRHTPGRLDARLWQRLLARLPVQLSGEHLVESNKLQMR